LIATTGGSLEATGSDMSPEITLTPIAGSGTAKDENFSFSHEGNRKE